MKRYLKNKSFLTGAILAFIMLGMLVVSLFWLPYDPEEMYLAPKLSLPSISHLMGTDQFGRDVLSRIMKGIQVSFGIGVVVVVAGGLVGTLLGACSGYFGGYVDEVIMKIVDAQMAFPGILLALMLMCIFGRGLSNTILALSIMSIPRFVRMARSGFCKSRACQGSICTENHVFAYIAKSILRADSNCIINICVSCHVRGRLKLLRTWCSTAKAKSWTDAFRCPADASYGTMEHCHASDCYYIACHEF